MSRPLSQLPIDELIAAIGSDRVAPGAGSAGAVALALAAACVAKAASISLKHRPHERELIETLERSTFLARAALTEAERDAAAFEDFIHAKSKTATAQLLDTSQELGELIEELRALIEKVEPRIEPIVAGDILAARALAEAARCIQSRNATEARQEQAGEGNRSA
jgi:formiminotetrahydrofolate cyclodeaminase